MINSNKWKDQEIWCCGHNFNKELGNYEIGFVDKFVPFGHYYQKDFEELRLSQVYTGNGIIAIAISNSHMNGRKQMNQQNEESESMI